MYCQLVSGVSPERPFYPQDYVWEKRPKTGEGPAEQDCHLCSDASLQFCLPDWPRYCCSLAHGGKPCRAAPLRVNVLACSRGTLSGIYMMNCSYLFSFDSSYLFLKLILWFSGECSFLKFLFHAWDIVNLILWDTVRYILEYYYYHLLMMFNGLPWWLRQ